jgi:hypothetical protein
MPGISASDDAPTIIGRRPHSAHLTRQRGCQRERETKERETKKKKRQDLGEAIEYHTSASIGGEIARPRHHHRVPGPRCCQLCLCLTLALAGGTEPTLSDMEGIECPAVQSDLCRFSLATWVDAIRRFAAAVISSRLPRSNVRRVGAVWTGLEWRVEVRQ